MLRSYTMKLHEEFKLWENMWDSPNTKRHPWMKDVPLVYPELCVGGDAEDEILIKYVYLAGPEDVAEVLGDIITEEDVTNPGYDFHSVKTDCDALYNFLDTNFDRLVAKYDEELLDAFESKAVKQAQLEAKEEYDIYPEGNPFFHEGAACDNKKPLKEDNMADMRRSIRAEIAELEAEKAADTDPTSAVYYDEKIAACKAELAHLSDIAPTRATAKKRELKAKNEEIAKNIERRLRYLAFTGLYSIYKRPRCISTKDGEFKIYFNKQLNQEAIIEAEKICADCGIPVKYNAQEQVFIVDKSNMNLHKNAIDIDTEAILHRLNNDTTSYTIIIDDSNKSLENSGISKDQAFKEIETFIKKLTEAEIANLGINWWWNDGKRDEHEIYSHNTSILQLESPVQLMNALGISRDEYEKRWKTHRLRVGNSKTEREIAEAIRKMLNM